MSPQRSKLHRNRAQLIHAMRKQEWAFECEPDELNALLLRGMRQRLDKLESRLIREIAREQDALPV